MDQCNFQAVELTHISLCGRNLPVMNLPGHCSASITESTSERERPQCALIFQHTHPHEKKKKKKTGF